MKLFLLSIALFPFCFISLNICKAQDKELNIHPFPILSEKRIELTRQYAKQHSGIDSPFLSNPQMIVVHYTVTHTLRETLALFSRDELDSSRKDIANGGRLNVGVHFLIDKNGEIYSLLPLTIMGRHTIGFNHTAIGIELIAMKENDLTKKQLESCAAAIAFICKKKPSVKYLFGHHEYMDKSLPHFILYKELDPNYSQYRKYDPGAWFMKQLREKIYMDYQIELLK